jgi:hypothetical protein
MHNSRQNFPILSKINPVRKAIEALAQLLLNGGRQRRQQGLNKGRLRGWDSRLIPIEPMLQSRHG